MSHPIIITAPQQIILGKTPGIFLAGPIQQAPHWQQEACQILASKSQHFIVMNPRQFEHKNKDFTAQQYHEQVNWRHEHINHAISYGVMLFWLAKPVIRTAEHAYAQTTRFELGEAMAKHIQIGNKVVVGLEDGFGDEEYIRQTLAQKSPNINIINSLHETVAKAHELLWIST